MSSDLATDDNRPPRSMREIINSHHPLSINSLRLSDPVIVKGLRRKPYVIKPTTSSLLNAVVWKAISLGLRIAEEEKHPSSSRTVMARATFSFLCWAATLDGEELNRLDLLQQFADFEVLDEGKKSSGNTMRIIQIIKIATDKGNRYLSSEEVRHLHRCIDVVQIVRSNGSARSLCDWFLDIDWLRERMENKGIEHLYLKLESPRLFSESLQLCYATMLLELDRFRQDCLACAKPSDSEISRDLIGAAWENNHHGARELIRDQLTWFAPIIRELPKDSSGLAYFFCSRYGSAAIRELKRYESSDSKRLIVRLHRGSRQLQAQSPNIFGRCHLIYPSAMEQMLVVHLLAILAVQPFQASKLKLENTIVLRNSRGRAVGIQIKYRKNRARHQLRETAILPAANPVGRALLRYLELISTAQPYLTEAEQGYITPHFAKRSTALKLGLPRTGGALSIPNLMTYWLGTPAMYKKVCHEYRARGVSRVFLDSFLTVMNECSETYSRSKKKQNTDALCGARMLPKDFWGTRALKQLGVFARSDLYRVGDLVNQNSHTAETERLRYLNDRNKDWVNRYGRILRIVIDDLRNNVFQPDLDEVQRKAIDRTLRTELVEASDAGLSEQDVTLNTINPYDLTFSGLESNLDFGQIVVLDHPATVVYILHYLDQAENNAEALARCSPDFFELTVAPRCEWMEQLLLRKLSSEAVRKGKEAFEQTRADLPNLFRAQLRK